MNEYISYQIKDPVCEMMVDPHNIEIVYQQMHFAFCSEQCKERFLVNPHLYIGYPGEKAPKQAGKKVIKRHRIRLDHTLTANEATIVYGALNSLMGIKELLVMNNTIDISYDLLQTTLQQIEDELMTIGVELGGDWVNRLRRSLLHKSEKLQLDSMEIAPPCHHH